MGWIQAIYKETQETRASAAEVRKHIHLLPEIKDATLKGAHDSGDAERMIQETRSHLEGRIDRLESLLHDIQNTVKDIKSRTDRIG